MRTKYIVYTLLIVIFGSLVAYRIVKNKSDNAANAGGRGGGGGGGAKGGKGGKGGGPQGPMRVQGIIVTPQRFSTNLSVSGSIEANEQVQIRSEVSGLVRSINFKEGSQVSKGQVLLKIDDSELRAQLAQAITRQELAAGNEHRAGLLLKKEAISQEEYDTALADLRSLQSQTQLIRAQLAKTEVRAPFSGKIGLRSISAGEYLTPATMVANLVNANPVKIQLSIPEKYAGQINSRSPLTFTVAGSTKKFTATVYAVEPGIDLTTRTLQLRATAPNPTGELLPGAFAKIELPLATVNDAILIPTESVIPVFNGKKVFVADSGVANEVMIETTARTDKAVVVASGLKAGDTVITSGIMALKPKSPVKVAIKGSKGKP